MKFCPFVRKILNGNEILALIKGHNSGTNVRKITVINTKLDLVNMYAYTKIGENPFVCSRDNEGKRNFGVHQGL